MNNRVEIIALWGVLYCDKLLKLMYPSQHEVPKIKPSPPIPYQPRKMGDQNKLKKKYQLI